jgi:hypothetical protein
MREPAPWRDRHPVGRFVEVTFKGEADRSFTDEFDAARAVVERGTTRLYLDGRDPSALYGVLARLAALELELLDVRAGESPP